jgi:hypothetical protein
LYLDNDGVALVCIGTPAPDSNLYATLQPRMARCSVPTAKLTVLFQPGGQTHCRLCEYARQSRQSIGDGKSSPMPVSRDANLPVAVMATAALGLLSVVAIRMMWLGIYAAFWID